MFATRISGVLISVAFVGLMSACTDSSTPTNTGLEPQFSKGGNPGNPKYSKADYGATSSTLELSFKQTGLGSFSSIDYVLTADFSATVTCYNKPHNQVHGQPFNFSATLSDNSTENPRNGQVTATKTLGPPLADCGNPQQFVPEFSNVQWSNIQFCWGQSIQTQGPVPLEPGDGSFVMEPGDAAAGSPLDGDQAGATGIFASPCLAGQG